jgi:hypothetical protein
MPKSIVIHVCGSTSHQSLRKYFSLPRASGYKPEPMMFSVDVHIPHFRWWAFQRARLAPSCRPHLVSHLIMRTRHTRHLEKPTFAHDA